MSNLILLSFLVFSTAAVGSDSVREVYYQADTLTPSNIAPTFENGYLVVYGRRASVYAPDGSLAYSISPPEDGVIHNVAVDTDQTAAAAVEFGGGLRRGIVTIFNRTGSPVRVIDTGRYLPSFVCFAPDHSIWTTGRQERQSFDDHPEYYILRHFSRDGKELGASLPRSSFEDDDKDPAWDIVGLSGLRVANHRIGAVLTYGGNLTRQLWVEAGLNGKETGRWRVDIGFPAAFRPKGAVYARGGGSIWVLDRVTGKWNPVPVQPDGLLLGADGESLVFMLRGTPALRWVPVNP